MYLSCSSLIYTKKQAPRLSKTIRQVKALGFDTIDLAAFEGWQDMNPSAIAAGDQTVITDLKEALHETGLTVCSINCKFSTALNDPAEGAFSNLQNEFTSMLKLADEIGASNLTLQPGSNIEGLDFKHLMDAALSHLEVLYDLASPYGISLSLEGHEGAFVEAPRDLFQLIQTLWPKAGITYDPSHFVMQEIPLAQTEFLIPLTRHVHLRNASVGKMQETMEDGKVDFKWCIDTLNQYGYDGPVTIEYFNGFDAEFKNLHELRHTLTELGVRPTQS